MPRRRNQARSMPRQPSTNRLNEAEPLMRRALAIDESLGPDDPDVARDHNNLALLLQNTHRPEKAERHMRQALAIDEKSLGAKHPNVARDLDNLAGLLQQREDWIGSYFTDGQSPSSSGAEMRTAATGTESARHSWPATRGPSVLTPVRSIAQAPGRVRRSRRARLR
jgi:tetratricopeptide (TPR) repeat protein